MSNTPIFCIVGMSGSGKTTILDGLIDYFIKFSDANIKRLVYHTTRKKRPNEIDGSDYVFDDKIPEEDKIVEIRGYKKHDEGTVYYYTTYDDIKDDKVDAYICAASMIQTLRYIDQLENVHVICLKSPVKDRIYRALSRANSNDQCLEVCRRMLEEREEFGMIDHIDSSLIYEIDNSNSSNLDMNIIQIAGYINDTLAELV